MKRHEHSLKHILKETREHIGRNRWLSTASVIVITLTFMIATTFTAMVVMTQRVIRSLEQKAPVDIFFLEDTAEEDIFALRDQIELSSYVTSVEYVSREQALESYAKGFEDYPELLESVTVYDMPPSLGIHADSIEDIPEIIELANALKEDHPEIDSVMYYQDVIDNLRSISRVVQVGGSALVIAMTIISVTLMLITIGFNINAHQHEIEVMQLVGSTDSYIRVPFLLEGAVYGMIGGGISTGLLLTLWYSSIHLIRQGDMAFFFMQILTDINMPYLKSFDPVFVSIAALAVLAIGALVGFFSSLLAIWKYLK